MHIFAEVCIHVHAQIYIHIYIERERFVCLFVCLFVCFLLERLFSVTSYMYTYTHTTPQAVHAQNQNFTSSTYSTLEPKDLRLSLSGLNEPRTLHGLHDPWTP